MSTMLLSQPTMNTVENRHQVIMSDGDYVQLERLIEALGVGAFEFRDADVEDNDHSILACLSKLNTIRATIRLLERYTPTIPEDEENISGDTMSGLFRFWNSCRVVNSSNSKSCEFPGLG